MSNPRSDEVSQAIRTLRFQILPNVDALLHQLTASPKAADAGTLTTVLDVLLKSPLRLTITRLERSLSTRDESLADSNESS